MFFNPDDTVVNYHYGTNLNKPGLYLPYTLKQKYSNNLLLSAFTTVRTNCEEACSTKLLADMSDELKQEYRDNTKIAQIVLKSRNDSVQSDLDSCIRRCFVKRVTSHFGKEIQDYVYATAFEYQQSDFHFFDVNPIHRNPRNPKMRFPAADFKVADNLMDFKL